MVSLYISHKCALYQHVLLSVCRIIFYSMHLIPFRAPCFIYMAPEQRTRRLVLAPCESGATLSVKVVNCTYLIDRSMANGSSTACRPVSKQIVKGIPRDIIWIGGLV